MSGKEVGQLRKLSCCAWAEARKNLGKFPQMGFEKQGLPIPAARCLVVGDYILDYEIIDGDIYITAVRPGQKPDAAIEVTADFDYED